MTDSAVSKILIAIKASGLYIVNNQGIGAVRGVTEQAPEFRHMSCKCCSTRVLR
ncbi:hypothetical protein CT19431_MP100051 [Cupriavidus taiwanensis]|nr:hypothetical protein CT19431_MP100051 [Cupriavidus taiwanensis]